MDSLTHTVLGACIGEAIAGKKMGRKAMFWGAVANNIPDIDVLISSGMNAADSLLAHRGFTHSFLFAIIATPLLAYIFHKRNKNSKVSLTDWLLIFGSGIIVHDLIDALTVYGTGWFEPFSHKRVTFNVLFVLDPLYTIAPLIAFVALLVLNWSHHRRRFWTQFGIILSSVYLCIAIIIKSNVDKTAVKSMNDQKIYSSNYFSTPTPLNNLLWYIVVKNDSGYFSGYHSVFDKDPKIKFEFFQRNQQLLSTSDANPDIEKLIRFSNGYYTIENINDTIYFNDLRFGQIGGWNTTQAPFVFRYSLKKDFSNDMVIQKGRMQGSPREAIVSLWRRIFSD